ncbi:hypothetical protein [Rivularia sp. UHCC 0363]|uniref:hypothetical protein n=1 Tax=Rivularia sp. UHCC 0363 TaxID=3110244 RepID=UPI002B1F4AD5|nr:hypothetical protein [Rivularia sp. UHCC 0363]MEA5594400.1 hypothetical protein [Rivularia sp. UHCC 0363]
MAALKPQYSKEEFGRVGDEIYTRDIYPQLQADSQGKIVAIDITTGAWEIDNDEISVCNRLEKRYPSAQIWIVKVGSKYVRRFGASRTQKAKTR